MITDFAGWTVEYLIQVRDGDPNTMGFVAAGFSGGSLLGRLILAEPTYRFGERRMIFLYTLLSVALVLVFWLYVSPLFVHSNHIF